MTMLQPAGGIVTRALNSIGLKALLSAALISTGWHYKESGEIKTVRQQSADQEKRLDTQGDALKNTVDRETYFRGQQELLQQLHEVRLREDQTLQILMERGK